MCRRNIARALPLVALILGGCCIEGYPAIRERDVALHEVPERVRRAFARDYDLDEISRVEHAWHNSVCTEDLLRYRFHLLDRRTVTFDHKGRPAPWVPGSRAGASAPGGE
jgi:hypothetical protein